MGRAAEVGGSDPVSETDPYPRIEAGTYEVRCYATKLYWSKAFRRWVCRLDCQLLYDDVAVCGFLNLGNEKRSKAGRKSLYWRVWVMANGAQPQKRQTLSRSVFVDKFFQVRIGEPKRRYDNTEPSEAEKYSTVQEWIACVGP
jgi:hypothetical protein